MELVRIVSLSFRAICAFTLFASPAAAQVQESWIGSTDVYHEGTYGVAIDAAGNVAVAGITRLDYGAQSLVLVQRNASGAVNWTAQHLFAGLYISYMDQVVVDPQGDVFVAVHSSGAAPLSNFGETIFAYSVNGTPLWTDTILDARVARLATNASGELHVAWSTDNPGAMLVRKYDSAGQLLWQNNASVGVADDQAIALALAPNGDVCVAGRSGSNAAAMRLGSGGAVVWAREINIVPALVSQVVDAVVDAAGTFVVIIESNQSGTQFNSSLVVALDSAGNTVWSDVPVLPGGTHLLASPFIARNPLGGVVVAETVQGSSGAASRHIFVTSYDGTGMPAWHAGFDQAGAADYAHSIVVDALGNAYVAGVTIDVSTGGSLPLVVEFDPRGETRMTYFHVPASGPSAHEQAQGLALFAPGSLVLTTQGDAPGSAGDLMIIRLDRTALPYCFGDGTATACPCGNASTPAAQAGCASSLGLGGRLIDAGSSSLANDTLVLLGSDMPNSGALFFQGTAQTNGGAGLVFGDGLRCLGGTITRLATKLVAGNAAQYPDTGDAPVSVRGSVGAPGRRTYQIWYRNAASFCTSATFNLSNGLLVTWTP